MTSENEPEFKRRCTESLGMSTQENKMYNVTDFAGPVSWDPAQDVRMKRPRVQDSPTSMTEAKDGSPIPLENISPDKSGMQAQTSAFHLEARNIKSEQPQRAHCMQQAEGAFMTNAELGSRGNEPVSNFMYIENPQVVHSSLGGFVLQQQLPVTHNDLIQMMIRVDHLSNLVTTQINETQRLSEMVKTLISEVLEIQQVQRLSAPYRHHHPSHALPVVPMDGSGMRGINLSSSHIQRDNRKTRHS